MILFVFVSYLERVQVQITHLGGHKKWGRGLATERFLQDGHLDFSDR